MAMLVVALSTAAKMWEQPECPRMGDWIKMTWCVHTMEYYAAVKKDKRLPSATTRMGLEGALLSEKAKTNTV